MENSVRVLVTGGSGFVSLRCIFNLLQQGYEVRATLRSLNKKGEVIEALKTGGLTSFDRLSFAEASLTEDKNWPEAMQGCTYVLSVASPVFHGDLGNEEEAMRPTVEGTVRVLQAARDAGVKRVVMTANFGAVGFSNKDTHRVTTEKDWTRPDEKGLSAYEKSKLLAELAAWRFIKEEGRGLELTTVNAVAILGPSLGPHISGSFGLLQHLLDGSMKAIPPIPLNVVDVRDVADLHLRAMTHPEAGGERFIAAADGQMTMPEIARLLKEQMPEVSRLVPAKTVPSWVIRVAALFNKQAQTGALLMHISHQVSNQKAKQLLGWSPVATQEQAILAAAQSIAEYGTIKQKSS